MKNIQMEEKDFSALLNKHGQTEFLDYFFTLDRGNKNRLLEQAGQLDFNLIFQLYDQFKSKSHHSRFMDSYKGQVIALIDSQEAQEDRHKAILEGKKILKSAKVAVLVAAGGQSSRLGWNGPKGSFPITPVKRKSLFQLFCEKIKALSVRYNNDIPVFFLVNEETYADVNKFFEENSYFGLTKGSIYFLKQNMLPVITAEGKLVLKDQTRFFSSPNGHGGALEALRDSGALDRMVELGISEIFYCQIDNPLVHIADALFLGYHSITEAEVSTKVIRRVDCEEKVGIFMSVEGKSEIVEYSEIDPKRWCVVDKEGKIQDWAGNTGIHVFSVSFLQRLLDEEIQLPYHRAIKNTSAYFPDSGFKQATVWKFEKFIFDMIPHARKTCCVETRREDEFAPLKNKDGMASPKDVSRAMNNIYKSWLIDAGIKVEDDQEVEISPLFALDRDEFIEKASAVKIACLSKKYYLGS